MLSLDTSVWVCYLDIQAALPASISMWALPGTVASLSAATCCCRAAAEGSLFEFVSGKEWRERGKGELRINLHKATHQARLVMRQRGSQRLLLNANLYPNMTTSKMVGGKGVTFAAVNAAAAVVQDGKDKEKEVAEGEGGEEQSADKESKTEAAASSSAAVMRTYALKVKSTERINAFVATVEKYKAGGAAVAAPEAGDDAV